MRRYLLDLKARNKTILIASHSAEDIEVLCDTVCETDKGVPTVLKGVIERCFLALAVGET